MSSSGTDTDVTMNVVKSCLEEAARLDLSFMTQFVHKCIQVNYKHVHNTVYMWCISIFIIVMNLFLACYCQRKVYVVVVIVIVQKLQFSPLLKMYQRYLHQTWNACSSWQGAFARQGTYLWKLYLSSYAPFLTKIFKYNDGPWQTSFGTVFCFCKCPLVIN